MGKIRRSNLNLQSLQSVEIRKTPDKTFIGEHKIPGQIYALLPIDNYWLRGDPNYGTVNLSLLVMSNFGFGLNHYTVSKFWTQVTCAHRSNARSLSKR